jgi:hypothetical protein
MIVFTKNEDGKECLITCEIDKIYDLCDELRESETFQRLEMLVKVKLRELVDERGRLVAMSKDENLSEDEREEAEEKAECLVDSICYLNELDECLNAIY